MKTAIKIILISFIFISTANGQISTFLIKLDSVGNYRCDWIYTLITTPDNYYLLSGSSSGGEFFLKVDSLGNFSKTVYTHYYRRYFPYLVGQKKDGNYVYILHSWDGFPEDPRSFRFVITDDDLNIKSEVRYDSLGTNAEDPLLYDMEATSDNGVLIIGNYSVTFGNPDVRAYRNILLKVDSLGEVEWVKRYNMTPGQRYLGYLFENIEKLGKDNYLIAGNYSSSPTDAPNPSEKSQGFVFKINSNGDSLWLKKDSGITKNIFYGKYDDDNYLLIKNCYKTAENYYDRKVDSIKYVKIDSNGVEKHVSMLFIKDINEKPSYLSMYVKTNREFILVNNEEGESGNEYSRLLCYDEQGNLLWSSNEINYAIRELAETQDGGLVMRATTFNYPYINYLIKSDGITGIENQPQKIPAKYILYQNYPNPFNPVTEIKFNIPESGNTKLVVYNTLGEKVKTLVDDYLPAGEHKVNFDAGELPSGIYFYKLTSGKYSAVKKMILMK